MAIHLIPRLIILGTHLTCKTNDGHFPNNSCVFPFENAGNKQNECIDQAKPYCQISVDEKGNSMGNKDLGVCSPGCPGVPGGIYINCQ